MGKMCLVPPNRDIVSVELFTVDYFHGGVLLLWRQLSHNVRLFEYIHPFRDGRHAMPEVLVEWSGHDDGVTRLLVVEGFFLLLIFA